MNILKLKAWDYQKKHMCENATFVDGNSSVILYRKGYGRYKQERNQVEILVCTDIPCNNDEYVCEGDIFDYGSCYVLVECIDYSLKLVRLKKPNVEKGNFLNGLAMSTLERFNFKDMQKLGNKYENPELLLC